MEKTVKILNEQGLHARPASIFVKTASKFKSTVSIVHGTGVANAKSIINIMSLGLKKDEEIKIVTEGADEKEAMAALVSLVETKFGEE
ncbi:HPr family phosphocarrier protein [Clostridium estertheticum]|uniref:Phosphocarrier protein HPr n=2 Tax=Clostridium estertheticum TaxID=238834 RepID=A0A1J0GLR7_9CLOT|nr:HPr family phosphocarrier protein [Clostridium estertheticum]APC42249.1 phosphocarrier protein HPr [Clostridium estertheticum subsp. estertheticum]MBU3073654.1 HPr family phosphocarrier protein [Clostridium estertheticum]MBU3163747.1 HPr family phosphocarrier protein [Clostridium estertheticum]MBU3172241.1 HPr family phosphocarrier protein [Clostridium estertheticum]MBU3186367.1 HPr family phosphocarrier protein [Clostridium estertheticum]